MSKRKDIETCFNYCSKDKAYFSSNERRWINKIHKLQKKYPDRVTIIKEPDENDKTIYASMPITFLRIQGTPVKQVVEEKDDSEIDIEDLKDAVE